MRTFIWRVRKASLVSAASVALVTSSPSAATIWTIHRQTRIWSTSSIRSVTDGGDIEPGEHADDRKPVRQSLPRGRLRSGSAVGGYATQRASASSSRYLPVVRNARSRRPLASGRTFAIAWLGVRASVAYTCWYSAESTPLDGSVANTRYPRL